MRFIFLIMIFILPGCQSAINYPNGGYAYPKIVAEKDTNFYYYPLKNMEPKKDSFRDALHYRYYGAFNEPNLSLKPMPYDIFRFVFTEWKKYPVIITLSNRKIIVKEGNSEFYESYEDVSKLTDLEREHLRLLINRFPIDTSNQPSRMKKYMDSITRLYPQLLDPKYYLSLVNKAIVPLKSPFTYKTKMISLSMENYLGLVDLINASGYWGMPYNQKCEYPDADGYNFLLEANTANKYNIVRASGCDDDTSKFTKACQKLVDYAHMNKQIKLIWK